MAGPYCGKGCESCALREQLSCSGCRSGPGRTWGTECKLARCCQQKGHESCQTCSFAAGCRLFSGRNEQPQYRLQERERSAQRQQEAAQKAEVLGKWLWILFWLMIVVQPVVGLMSDETVVGWFPQLYWPADCELAVFACRRRDPSENFRGGIKLPHSRYLPDCGRCCQFCGAAFYRRGHGKRLAAAGPAASDSGVPGGAVPLLHGARGGFVQGRRHACGQMGCFVEMEHRNVCTVLCQWFAGICPDIYRDADAAGRHHWNGGCHNSGSGVPVPDGPAVSPHCR